MLANKFNKDKQLVLQAGESDVGWKEMDLNITEKVNNKRQSLI